MSGIPVLVVCGPTASGKTKLAVQLAIRLGGEVVSADSMQVYKGMDIGTAKPTTEEMCGVPHHLIGIIEPETPFSVADYVTLAQQAICDIRARGKLPVLAGGTGLYISSLIDNIRFAQIKSDPDLRKSLEDFAENHGNEALWGRLNENDPELAAKLHPNNRGRIIRAVEVYETTGVNMSEHLRLSRAEPSPYVPFMLGLTFSRREILYERIDRRVDEMIKSGLVEEAREFAARGKTSGQAIGYKELQPYFAGACTLDEAVENIKRETRRYAKRQLTWLRRDERIRWIVL
ncbi:MAG: tRNA (adenosine(37)-N6)-dimethylallyltransferase MiaA [Oscillospiraceae bacterium]|nr:tRNA (adenosine(37)-N6)-dimethylallyltransferase MiaA [Oscillospiraceae bacterium]